MALRMGRRHALRSRPTLDGGEGAMSARFKFMINPTKKTHMIPFGAILLFAGIVCLIYGANEYDEPSPITVGEQFLEDDPFKQNHPITVMEISGDWVKYTQRGDSEGSFRSATLKQFRAWYPNRYEKAKP